MVIRAAAEGEGRRMLVMGRPSNGRPAGLTACTSRAACVAPTPMYHAQAGLTKPAGAHGPRQLMEARRRHVWPFPPVCG